MKYRSDVRNVYRKLNRAEQVELYNKMKGGSKQARDEIINSCLPLVYNLAAGFHKTNKNIPLGDMIQEGNLALVKAVDNWDISSGNLITTVATVYVRNSLIDLIKEGRYDISKKFDLTKKAAEDLSKIKAVESDDIDLISKKTGLRKKRIKELLYAANGSRVRNSSAENAGRFFDILMQSGSQASKYAGKIDFDGCLADLITLSKEIPDKRDKEIFLCWLDAINKNNRARIVANKVGASVEEVSNSIKTTKRFLRERWYDLSSNSS